MVTLKKKPGRSRVFSSRVTAVRLLLNLQFRTTVLPATGLGVVVTYRIGLAMADRAFPAGCLDSAAGPVGVNDGPAMLAHAYRTRVVRGTGVRVLCVPGGG